MLDNLTRRLSGIFAGLRKKGRLTEDDVTTLVREIRVALLEADVNFQVAKEFVARVKDKAVGEELFSSLTADQTLVKIVRDELVELLGTGETPVNWSPAPPTTVLMAGLQGSGKTTTCAKLARTFLKQGKKPLLVACDLQRPAAVKQLEVLAEQVGAGVFGPSQAGANPTPVSVARHAIDHARHYFFDVVVLDTAGRSTLDDALMAEIGQIHQATRPSEVFLVLDSTTGQEAVTVAEAFHERLKLTGAIFTKLDGDTRGGAVLSVRAATGVPVRYLGVGEQTEALETFAASRMAERILGMGDVIGIIEKAEEAFRGEDLDTLDMQTKMRTGKIDFNDMLQNFKMMRKMGSLKNVMKMVPGMSAMMPEGAIESLDDSIMDRAQAIILSMTPYERSHPDIINGSRRKRIAKGSGTSQEEVNRLLDNLFNTRKQMKQFSKVGRKMQKLRRK